MHQKFNRVTFIALLVLVQGAAGAEYYVAQNNQTPGDHLSWTSAASNIQEVVAAGSDNSTIWVGPGRYTIPPGAGVSSDGTTNLVFMSGKRFAIRGTTGDPADVVLDGEGMARGAYAYYASWDTLKRGYTFEALTFSNCASSAAGGALYFETSGTDRSWTGRVENCVFTQNAAANGGAIYFINRSSTAYPGLVVSNSLFRANRTTGVSYGSAINVYRQVATHLTDCLIEGPQPAGAGSVLYAFASLCKIDRCTIRDNLNDQANGLLFFYSCNTSVRNTLLHGNTSSFRGLLNLHESGTLTVENCTLASNACGTAGAINLRAYAGGAATVYNAVIVSNAGAVVAGTEGVAHFTNSCVSSAQNIADFEAGGNITDDPLFVDFGSANFRLRGSSPCIDSGLGLSWMASARDLDANARIDRRSGVVDRGCYEHTDAGLLLTIR